MARPRYILKSSSIEKADMNASDTKLNLPVWPDAPVPPKRMTMEEYAAFVEFCWKNLPNRERLLAERLRDVPTVRFEIR